jgi:hypothetical protein
MRILVVKRHHLRNGIKFESPLKPFHSLVKEDFKGNSKGKYKYQNVAGLL